MFRKVGPYKIKRLHEGYWSNKNLNEDFREKEDPVITLERKDSVHGHIWVATIMNGPWSENEAFYIKGSFNYCIKELRANLSKVFA